MYYCILLHAYLQLFITVSSVAAVVAVAVLHAFALVAVVARMPVCGTISPSQQSASVHASLAPRDSAFRVMFTHCTLHTGALRLLLQLTTL
jgi:hypothetical protein